MFEATAARPSAVLIYHRVASLARDVYRLAITPEAFRSQLATLTRHWQVVPLAELVPASTGAPPPQGRVALTFDDGYLDNLEIVLPILEEFDAPATFFLTTASLRRPSYRYWWDVLDAAVLACPLHAHVRSIVIGDRPVAIHVHDAVARQATHDTLYRMLKTSAPAVRDAAVDQLAAFAPAERFDSTARPLAAADVQRVARHPLIDVGAHTVHHVALSTASADDLAREVSESRAALESATGRPVPHFAYPYGDLSPAALRTVEAAGFAAAVTCESRPLRAREDRLRIPRVSTFEEDGASLNARLGA
jgi:peptidoglycan/xylan/chitin deacetylase (PgdA/CDA1 family)